MSNFEHLIKEDSTEFEKAFLKIYDGSLWTALEKMKDWQPPKELVEVPQFVADFIKTLKIRGIKPLMDSVTFREIDFTEEKRDETLHWINEHQEEYMRAWLDDYTVEKPQLFYLKHIDFCKTDKHYDWFTIKFSDGALNHLIVEKGEKPSTIDCKFTQQEIDSMQTGSYEQIEV